MSSESKLKHQIFLVHSFKCCGLIHISFYSGMRADNYKIINPKGIVSNYNFVKYMYANVKVKILSGWNKLFSNHKFHR